MNASKMPLLAMVGGDLSNMATIDRGVMVVRIFLCAVIVLASRTLVRPLGQ